MRSRLPGALAPPLMMVMVAWLATSCWLPFGRARIPAELAPERVPGAIESAREELAAGDTERALDWMRAASGAPGLSPELRDEVQGLLEEAAARRIDELSMPDRDPEELAEMLDLGLPRQLAVSAGVRAARRMFELGEPLDAYYLVKKIDARFPLHHERVAAGDLLADIGFSLAQDDSSFLGFHRTSDQAQEVLEYLTLNAPWCSRSDLAFVTLADLYEGDGDWQLAIDRLEQLVLNHPTSPLRIAGQARIPHLRLAALKSPEYDRGELRRARTELEKWLRDYAGNELEASVRLDLADCLRRLCENDLIIARFYRRIGNAYGARLHARRAVEEAQAAGDEARARSAQASLDELSPVDPSRPEGREARP